MLVDEPGIEIGARSAYAFSPRGEPCVETAPFRVGQRINLLGWTTALGGSVRAYEGSVRADVFEAFVAASLVPCLEAGDVVVLDNARIHSPAAVAPIEGGGRGCSRNLPTAPI